MGCAWQGAFREAGRFLNRVPLVGALLKVALPALLCMSAGPACAPLVAILTSAAVAGIQSGKLGQALKAGLITAATIGAFKIVGDMTGAFEGADPLKGGHGTLRPFSEAHMFNIAGHAVVGCLSAVASGGGGKGCRSGALSGAVGALGTPFINTGSPLGNAAAHGLIGGLASVAGGGKFENGAVTAAFGYLFNASGVGAALFGQLGAYGGATLGSVLSGLCISVTGGTCAVAAPYIVAGSVAIGRIAGGWAGNAIEDWVFNASTDDKEFKEVPGTDKQFGQKFGQHMDPDQPGYRTIKEYRELANQIYNDSDAVRQIMNNGETQITDRVGNLLRLDPSGNFRSLYPLR